MARAKSKAAPVKWEAPPDRPKQYPWAAIAAELRKHPGEWALIFEGDRSSVVIAIRQGAVGDVHPDLGFETSTRNNKRGTPRTCDLYMRYNPDRETSLTGVLLESRKKEK